jgi:CheY-like chemotaxis protein
MPGLVKLLARTLGERVTIATDLDDRLPEVCVDHAQFEAALINLAVNARDAMPDGGTLGIRIQGRAAPAPDGGEDARTVEIAITDTGTGMSPSVLARVFEPFFTTKEAGKGTGLGLSMVYGFVQQSGGTIAVESSPGQGTRFVITLPARVGRSSPSQGAGPGAAAEPPETVNGAGKAVLVVEDDADVRSTIVSTLEALSFRVLSAQDGSEALRILESEPNIALVFSDVNMPGVLTGIELGHVIRRQWPAMPVLLASGYLKDDQDANGFQLLQKPYRATELISILRNLLSGTHAT